MDDEAAARGAFRFTAGLLAALFTAAALARLLAHGPSGTPANLTSALLVWPINWEFYQNPSDQEFAVVYRFDGGTRSWRPLTSQLADARHRWGLGHSGYAELAKLNAIVKAVPPAAWRPCSAPSIDECAQEGSTAARPTVISTSEVLLGPTVLAVERPAAWSASHSRTIVKIAMVELVRSR